MPTWILIFPAAAAICALLFAAYSGFRSRKKAEFLRSFGRPPALHYFDGDMERIRAYYDLFRPDDSFTVDEITWNDLDLDRVFRRVNSAQTLPGEQFLYSALRTPIFSRREFEERLESINEAETNAELRTDIQFELSKLRRRRNIDLFRAAETENPGIGRALFYIALDLALIASVFPAVFISLEYSIFTILILLVISLIYSRTSADFQSFTYIYRMVHIAERLSRLTRKTALEADENIAGALRNLRWLGRAGALRMLPAFVIVTDFFSMLFLTDLIAYELSKNKISEDFEDLVNVYEFVGKLDFTVCAASCRAGFSKKCVPEIDFDADGKVSLYASGLIHPLLENPVPNSVETRKPVLITGSNASGKSTFLKTVAVNVLFAQTLCVCLADQYRAPAFRVYSSMALRDDMAAGESYYIAEIKSLKRIIEASREKPPALCIVDEVLRGTNTVERIAASAEILLQLQKSAGLCIAATHDLELCSLLEGSYESYHFQESIRDSHMEFDYLLRKGSSSSRNAIRLLDLMGYDPGISENAEKRARIFLETGRWEK